MVKPSGPSGQSLSQFPQHEVTRSIPPPPGWDANPPQGYPQYFNPVTPKSEQHLISPYNITPELHMKVVRKEKMITRQRSS